MLDSEQFWKSNGPPGGIRFTSRQMIGSDLIMSREAVPWIRNMRSFEGKEHEVGNSQSVGGAVYFKFGENSCIHLAAIGHSFNGWE
jgi:hypothetical protein